MTIQRTKSLLNLTDLMCGACHPTKPCCHTTSIVSHYRHWTLFQTKLAKTVGRNSQQTTNLQQIWLWNHYNSHLNNLACSRKSEEKWSISTQAAPKTSTVICQFLWHAPGPSPATETLFYSCLMGVARGTNLIFTSLHFQQDPLLIWQYFLQIFKIYIRHSW